MLFQSHIRRISWLSSMAFFGWFLVESPDLAEGQMCLPPPDGIVAWWPLDESSGAVARDIRGSHDGALVGPVVHVPGFVGGGLALNGSGSFGSGPYGGVPVSPAAYGCRSS